MPTYEALESFWRDWDRLTREQQALFRGMVDKFVADLERGQLRAGLRVKSVQTRRGVFELTWAPDGRATFSFGSSRHDDDPHIIWRRVGTHEVLRNP